jgi:hypothetical protein
LTKVNCGDTIKNRDLGGTPRQDINLDEIEAKAFLYQCCFQTYPFFNIKAFYFKGGLKWIYIKTIEI